MLLRMLRAYIVYLEIYSDQSLVKRSGSDFWANSKWDLKLDIVHDGMSVVMKREQKEGDLTIVYRVRGMTSDPA